MGIKIFYLTEDNKNLENLCAKFLDNSPFAFFQQTLEWRNVIDEMGTDQSIYILAKEDKKVVGLLPLYIFRSIHGNIINSIPYPGPLGGILIQDGHKQKELIFKLITKGLDSLAQKEKCVLATLISSPFSSDYRLYKKYFNPDWELNNYTLYIDLKKPITTTSHFRNNLKRMIKKANNNKFYVEQSDSIKDIKEWYKLHCHRHKQLALAPLPEKILTGLLKHLVPSGKAVFFVVKKGKRIIAGCFTAYHKDVVDTYIYSGNEESYKNGAIYLLIDHVLKWAKNNNFKILNWQSSKPKGGGPYNFKLQWGSVESQYFFFTKKYGSIDKILKLGVSGAREKYKWHFVLPYSVFENSESLG